MSVLSPPEPLDTPGDRVVAVDQSPRPPAGPIDACTAAEAAERLGVDLATGLTTASAAERLATHGPNRLAEPPVRPRWKRFVDQFRSLLVLILALAAALAAALGDGKDAVVVAFVLVLNAVLGYVQEGRAENAMAALREMLTTHARVRRDGRVVEVAADEVVPGDIVLLEAGDRLCADGRFTVTVNALVDESSLTGESEPVDKTAEPFDGAGLPLGDQRNAGFANTTLVRGRAELLVARTGMATEMGQVAAMLHAEPNQTTPLQRQLDKLGTRLAMVAGAAVAVVLVTRLAQGSGVAVAVLDAVALAVAAIPEGLPAVVTVTLAVGVRQLALRRAIVKRLASVETLGSTTVICSDKTGTLTMNEMTARTVVTAAGSVPLAELATVPGADELVRPGALCSDAVLRDGVLVGDPTEGALLGAAEAAGIDVDHARSAAPRIAEVPFDSATKLMATFHRDGDDVVVMVKGAPDVVLAHSVAEWTGTGTSSALDENGRARWREQNHALASQGTRVLALASRRMPAADALADGPHGRAEVADPAAWIDGLTLHALVGIIDPPRPEAADAIRLCHRAGIAVKMITGDHALTAEAIARELGIGGRVVTGAELDAMADHELAAHIDQIGVFARVSPEHKVRVVEALRAAGHITAMTGDGVNDAAALRTADIGVAMGITGTEVTKEAADVVLTDDNFATIVGAVERGRAILDNIITFVRFQVTTSLGAIMTILGASLVGLPTPLTAVQVLFVNIIADGPPAMTLGVDPPARDTMRRPPRAPGAPILGGPRLLRLVFVGTVMATGTLGLMAYAGPVWGDAVAATMAFTTFVLFQMVNVFNARAEHLTVLSRDSLRNGKLWLAAAIVVLVQVLAVELPALQQLFNTVALSWAQWGLCIVVALSVLVAEELRKLIGRAVGAGPAGRRRSRPEPQLPARPTLPNPAARHP